MLRCAAEYDKRVVVLHPKDTCPFPKFEEQPLEFRDTVMMEDVLIYSQGKHNAVIKELDEKLQLVGFPFIFFSFSLPTRISKPDLRITFCLLQPERKLDRGGLLTVQIVKAENLAAPGSTEVKNIYCIIDFDQNGVILDAKKDSDPSAPEWKGKAKL